MKIEDIVKYKSPDKEELKLFGVVDDIRNDLVYVIWNNNSKFISDMKDLVLCERCDIYN